MCTITYIPKTGKNKGFTVTDNRDESVNRPADLPKVYKEYGTQLFYPKDKKAGGTWIGLSQRNRLVTLMNGAFAQHKRKKSYKKSRGIVVKELLALNDVLKDVKSDEFEGIEPFYSIVFSWAKEVTIAEIIWNGEETHINHINPEHPKIWSSAMTYSPEQHQKRKDAFNEFLSNQKEEVSDEAVWAFHHTKGKDGAEGLLIDRGALKTTSVSQFKYRKDKNNLFRFESKIDDQGAEYEVLWK